MKPDPTPEMEPTASDGLEHHLRRTPLRRAPAELKQRVLALQAAAAEPHAQPGLMFAVRTLWDRWFAQAPLATLAGGAACLVLAVGRLMEIRLQGGAVAGEEMRASRAMLQEARGERLELLAAEGAVEVRVAPPAPSRSNQEGRPNSSIPKRGQRQGHARPTPPAERCA